MTKIIGFCEGVTDPDKSFELDRSNIVLLAPTSRTLTGDILGLYAFKCGDCGEDHVRIAGQRTIEALVLFGVVPGIFHPSEMPAPEDELARDLVCLELTPADEIIKALDSGQTEPKEPNPKLTIYV